MNHTPKQATPHRHRAATRRQKFAALAATGSLVFIASCGDDEPDAAPTTTEAAPTTTEAAPTTTEAAAPTTAAPTTTEAAVATTVPETTEASSDADAEYCAAAAEINSLDAAPTLEQVQAYAELAPDDIADTVAEVVATYEDAGGEIDALFGDDEFLDLINEIGEFEDEYCGFESDDESSNSIPDDPYCEIALEIYNTDDFPTMEQLEAYAAVAPDEIAGPVAVAIEGFASAGDDFDGLFSDPEFVEAVTAIEAFEFEYCGIGEGPTPENQLDPNAMRVDIVATDYEFDFEAPTAAGRYSFVMQNNGGEPHLMILAKLEVGADLDAVLESEGEEGVAVELESDLALPGTEAIITADLDAGNWVLLCPIGNADETPHFVLGMIHEFTIE